MSVTVGPPAEPELVASSDQLAQQLDGAQMLAGEGPCQTAWEISEPVLSPDLREDKRWPGLAEHLHAITVRSAVAAPIRIGDDLAGALNVYSAVHDVTDPAVKGLVEMLGEAVAAILFEITAKTELETLASQLQNALRSRATIEQAKGIVMASRGCGPDDAFAFLRKLSSERNVKLRDIAAEMVRDASAAERAGFDFGVMSDHYFPWLDAQGHAAYAWSMLGAVTQATERLELMTYVTCPILRYHPVVVAQKAATVALLSDNRFTLGLGAGENLNEHVIGQGWPPANVRHEMLVEAIEIISALLGGGYVNYAGSHFRVDSAKLWDLPEQRVPVGVAVSGQQSISAFAPLVDHLIAVQPDEGLLSAWDSAAGNRDTRKIGQLPICWDSDRTRAVERAHEQFRWFAGGWKVNAELPGTAGFVGATQYVTPEDVADSIPCGPDVENILEAVKAFTPAGFTDVALVQIGDEKQTEFLEFAESDLLPALRAAS